MSTNFHNKYNIPRAHVHIAIHLKYGTTPLEYKNVGFLCIATPTQ